MTDRLDESKAVLRTIWEAKGDPSVDLDEDCSPTKVCRNMREVTFDGYADDDADLATAWRRQLAQDGKLDPSASTIADLVLGDEGTP